MADDHRTPSSASLYDRDFYVWTQDQAAAIRAAVAAGVLPPGMDGEKLADEVEDMGKRDLRECWSRVVQILVHLWKLSASMRDEPRNHWRSEIRTQRFELGQVLTPSLRKQVEARLERLHQDAAELAERLLADAEPGAPPLDPSRRWTLAEILGEENDPLLVQSEP